MFLDTSINVAMQPFKMMVGDMVNEEQKGMAYSIQSFLCNAGSLVGYLFPYIFTYLGISNVAPEGVIPSSVIYSFYVGAAILILCVIYTMANVKEYSPGQMEAFSNVNDNDNDNVATSAPNGNGKKPSIACVFVSIGAVQFFCWAAFMYMWTYTNGAIASQCWGTTDVHSAGYQEAANWVGVVFAVQAIGSVVWAALIPAITRMTSTKMAYILSLVLGAVGFVSTLWVTDQYVLFASFLLIGCAWAGMLAFPFILFTNALQGNPKMGTYLGLFNCTICLPQIVAAVLGGTLLGIVGGEQVMMLAVAGVFLVLGSVCVLTIKSDNK